MNKLRMLLDPFILMLVGAVVLASILPARGAFVPLVGAVSTAGIILLFFLHGAKLSRAAIVAGASNWRLHLAIFIATYALFPVLGLALVRLPLDPPLLASGLLYLTLLPSTAMSSVALTAMLITTRHDQILFVAVHHQHDIRFIDPSQIPKVSVLAKAIRAVGATL